ncbi:MAG: glycine zipper 2TM domain-containing protein [Pseudoxanthomonas sp.]|nr:glycine zipper 2TM domain-containing protein [Pseudoxanthomonas sp.]
MNHRLLAIAVLATTALAGCTTTAPGYGTRSPAYSQPARCMDCGIITRIDRVAAGRTAPSATGALLGGIVGAVVGREISDQTGGSKGNQNIATVAGAAAGAVGGNAIQNRVTDGSYDVHVRMDDGRSVVLNQRDVGGLRENTYVRVVNGRVVLR